MATLGGSLAQLTPPPRRVPLPLTISSYLGGDQQFGWFLLLLTLAPLWYAQGTDLDPSDVFTFWGDTREVDGTVVALIEGESRKLGTYATSATHEYYLERYEILGVEYTYFGPDGTRHAGKAYGFTQADNRYLHVGATLPVEYTLKEPRISRAIGFDRLKSSTWLYAGWAYWIALAVMAISVPGVAHCVKGVGRRAELLSQGLFTQARVAWREPVRGRPNTYNVGLNFNTNLGEVEITTRTTDDEESPLGASCPLLYDDRNPQTAMLLKDFPGHLEVDDSGNLTEGGFNPYHYLWLPVFCALGYFLLVMDFAGIMSPGELLTF